MEAQRPAGLAKGEWGKLLILAGSSQFAGAGVLVTGGALRTGVDLLVTLAPERAANAILYAHPEAISIAVAGRRFDRAHGKLLNRFSGYTTAIGPGLTVQAGSQKFLKHALKTLSGPFVIDADALTMLAGERNSEKSLHGKMAVLTPNAKEFVALSGETGPATPERAAAVAQKYRAVVLCKGETDVISDGQQTEQVSGGSSLLAKAGSGDVLTGVIGALLARGTEPFAAAVLAAKALKAAGARGEERRGAGLVAGELPEYLDFRSL